MERNDLRNVLTQALQSPSKRVTLTFGMGGHAGIAVLRSLVMGRTVNLPQYEEAVLHAVAKCGHWGSVRNTIFHVTLADDFQRIQEDFVRQVSESLEQACLPT